MPKLSAQAMRPLEPEVTPLHLAETECRLTVGLAPSCSSLQHTQAAELLVENDRIPAGLALAIYRNNVSGALIKALSAAFPACRRVLGEPCFNGRARRFVEHNPSKQADLNLYGKPFGDFLDSWTAAHGSFSDYRYLGDLARLGWHCHTAYYAAKEPAFDFNASAKAGQEAADTLRLQLSPSLRLLHSAYPVEVFGPLPILENGDNPVEVNVKGIRVTIWVEKGLLFAMTEELELESIEQSE